MQIEVITAQGPTKVEAQQVGFSVVSENWNEYRLEDGRTLRTKVVLTRVMKPKDATILDPQGQPIISVQWQAVIVADEADAH